MKLKTMTIKNMMRNTDMMLENMIGYRIIQKIKEEIMCYELKEIKAFAKKHKWKLISHQKENCMISFRSKDKDRIRINVYYTTQTVGTCLNHPKKGKTQLFRRVRITYSSYFC